MTVGGVLSNALSALSVNQEALRVTSNNIANVNTENYARKVADQQAAVLVGQSVGVEIAEIRRIVDSFFVREALNVNSAQSQFQAEANYHDQLQALFGSPDGDLSLSSRINTTLSALGDLALDVTSVVRRADAVSDLQQMTDSFDYLSDQIQNIRTDVDRRIAGNIGTLNALFEQVHKLNTEIEREILLGGSAAALQDQRDAAISEISNFMDVETSLQSSGAMYVSTTDGFTLVGLMHAKFEYPLQNAFAADTIPASITSTLINPQTGESLPTVSEVDSHIASGELRGLLNMRDLTLPSLAEEVGRLAGVVADELNAIHNDNIAVPAPNSLTGRNTGLLAGDSHNFTGQTTMAVTAADGTLVSRIDIDFDAGTLSVDGGAPVALGTTVGSLTTALNTALGANGSATFVNGVLTVQATGATDGVGFLQDSANPSSRAGRGFSHFFGLNDLVTASRPSHFETGVSGTDAHGFTPGQTIDFVLRNADGDVAGQVTYTVAGANFNDILTGLNDPTTGLGSFMTFTLGANGEITSTPVAGFESYNLFIDNDATTRAGTGVSLTEMFGIGHRYLMEQANDMGLVDRITNNNMELSLAKLDLQGAVAGDLVVSESDNRGALDMQALENKTINVKAAGFLGATATTLTEYGAMLIADISTRADHVDSLVEDSTALLEEVVLRKESVQGVNMDEELANMMVYQQSYNAAARLITTARELFDALLRAV